jgi:hypothetical protein
MQTLSTKLKALGTMTEQTLHIAMINSFNVIVLVMIGRKSLMVRLLTLHTMLQEEFQVKEN